MFQNPDVYFSKETYSFAVGDMVTSKLPYDGNWYRAEVKDIVDGDLVLYFVDFGDTEIISQGNVRTLRFNINLKIII